MVNYIDWAQRHGVSFAAVHELLHMMGQGFESPQVDSVPGFSEAAVTSRVLLEAPSKGVLLWRNNLGAYEDQSGRWVRYGLANDSKKMNDRIKSSDFVGVRKELITLAHVGHIMGRFVAREIKEAGWKYNMHDPHEAAQAKYLDIVNAYGGDGAFCCGVGSL